MERDLVNANLKLAEESVALEESYLAAQARLNGLIQDQSRLMSGLDDLCYKHQNSKMVRFCLCICIYLWEKISKERATQYSASQRQV